MDSLTRTLLRQSKPKLREMPWTPWLAACDISRRMIAICDGPLYYGIVVSSRIRPIEENPEAHALVSCGGQMGHLLHGWSTYVADHWARDYPGVFMEAGTWHLLYLYPGDHMSPRVHPSY